MAIHAMGWKRQQPDKRDLRFLPKDVPLPPSVDLRPLCPSVYDQGQYGSCHDVETEVLTENGFKLFSELNGSERLATVNPDNGELHFELPTRLIRFPYSGVMYCVDNQSLNFMVTPEHKMLVRKWDEKKRTLDKTYQFVSAKNIGWYAGFLSRVKWSGEVQLNEYTLPGVEHKRIEQRSPKDIPMKSWVKFIGVYLAEGTMLKRDQMQGVISYKIQIAASKPREKEFIRTVLAEIGASPLELSDRFTFSNKRIYEALALLGLEGVKAGKKFVPSFIFRLSADMIKEFLSGHFAGDGGMTVGVMRHYTSSSKLAADLQALIFMSGNETRMSVRKARTSMTADGRQVVGVLDEHCVSVCERKNLSLDRKGSVFTRQYDGDVFCAEVPTYHTLVTRREGKILVSGNCTANAACAAFEFDLLKQGILDFPPSRMFEYYNTRVLDGDVDTDGGGTIRNANRALAKNGVCTEAQYPYTSVDLLSQPSSAIYAQAKANAITNYAAVLQDLYSMKLVLANGLPIQIGFTVYDSFEGGTTAQNGIIPMPDVTKEGALGGHAVLIVGFADTIAVRGKTLTNVFICRNSWGTGWGDMGYFYMPYAYYIDQNLSSDLWVINAVPGSIIPTPPTPVPIEDCTQKFLDNIAAGMTPMKSLSQFFTCAYGGVGNVPAKLHKLKCK